VKPPLGLDGAEVRTTHGSRVFLAGDRAYKVKKPVALGFLDYSTLERRRALCGEEVVLNRRLAPGRYLGVRALVPDGDRLRLAAEDDPAAVEYAVEMRRYREQDTLAARLSAGSAGVPELAALGRRLAGFHAAVPADATPGAAERAARRMDDTLLALAGLAPDAGARARVARSARTAGALLAASWDELEARGRAGRVRDGHGDLRLEHIVLEHGIEVVDCLEFDPGLRRIDVAEDLAFLVMELHERRRPDLARVLVDAYRRAGGDAGADWLLAAFAAYRAEVRAKVAWLRAAQRSSPAAAAADRDHGTALLALATRLRWAAHAPLVLMVAGLSGSGKTTVADALGVESGYRRLSADVVRKQRAGIAPTRPAPAAAYGDAASRATYHDLGRRARILAPEGVIVDATFRRRADRDAFHAALGTGVPVLHVECRAPAAVLEARIQARAGRPGQVSDAGPEVLRAQLAAPAGYDELPAAGHVPVRTDGVQVATVLAAITDAVDRRTASA
jgi:aminoglycoside phosphotransferase family enzyme/predicted kinase